MSIEIVCLSDERARIDALEQSLFPFAGRLRLTITDPTHPDPAALARADVLVCGHLSPESQARAKRARWIQFWTAGPDELRYTALFDDDVQVTGAPGLHAVPCAEHVLALMLAFARGRPQAFARQQQHTWDRDEIPPSLFELDDKTVGIVGAGAVGQAVGMRCRAFGMKTVGIRRDVSRPTPGIDTLLPHLRYHDLILASDFVVLALPLTAETRMMFGEDEVEIMKKGAYLINIGRGGLVDERWLLKALENRWIAGAGLDVFEDEPLPPDSPFWSLPNCIITPRVGGATPHNPHRFARFLAEQIERWLRGEPLFGILERSPGQ